MHPSALRPSFFWHLFPSLVVADAVGSLTQIPGPELCDRGRGLLPHAPPPPSAMEPCFLVTKASFPDILHPPNINPSRLHPASGTLDRGMSPAQRHGSRDPMRQRAQLRKLAARGGREQPWQGAVQIRLKCHKCNLFVQK